MDNSERKQTNKQTIKQIFLMAKFQNNCGIFQPFTEIPTAPKFTIS